MRRILMIAFHFPPSFGSSGLLRTVKFARYLPQYGWEPTVLTVHPRAHERTSEMEGDDDVRVERAFALDTARHLAFWGRYSRLLAVPDRWISWLPAGVLQGRRLIRQLRPDVLWSTFPIATAQLIGLVLHRSTGVPWVADFRDPMTEQDPATGIRYPLDPTMRRANEWIERRVVARCTRAVFTTEGSRQLYAERYPELPSSHWATIGNGYDEEDFRAAESTSSAPAQRSKRDGKIVLVHSGTIYSDARDPRAFFAAVADMRAAGEIGAESLRIVLRASGNEDHYRELLQAHRIDDIVFLEPAVPYREALREMLEADALLIFQAANCNWQVPAKLYECLRAGRPILAFTDPAGETAAVLRSEGITTIVPLDDASAIRAGFLAFVAMLREGAAPVARRDAVGKHSRENRTRQLATLLADIAGDRARSPR